ncbi:MAG: RAMP superfamily CRISPR-associated protein, partial [Candidatus Korarchaeum sp.]
FVCDILNPKGEDGELKRKEKLKESYRPCIICRVFGGPTIASHLTIRDSIPKGNVRTEKRTSVSISRITGGQYPGRLYDVEYVVPDSEFKFEMIIENLDLLGDSSEAKIVRYLLSLLQKGMISIGRRKSTGMGKVRLKELKATRLGFEEMGIKETEVTEELIRKLNES